VQVFSVVSCPAQVLDQLLAILGNVGEVKRCVQIATI
jgi:hypothetical protein